MSIRDPSALIDTKGWIRSYLDYADSRNVDYSTFCHNLRNGFKPDELIPPKLPSTFLTEAEFVCHLVPGISPRLAVGMRVPQLNLLYYTDRYDPVAIRTPEFVETETLSFPGGIEARDSQARAANLFLDWTAKAIKKYRKMYADTLIGSVKKVELHVALASTKSFQPDLF